MNKNTEDNKHKAHIVSLHHNIFIIWKPEYNLGIPIIDEQHRGIVTTINSLSFGMQHSYIKDMLVPIVDMMYDYPRIHFTIEEKFLEMIDFADVKKHRELHFELSTQLTKAGRDSTFHKDSSQFMNFLKQWWINHICYEDLMFRNHIASLEK